MKKQKRKSPSQDLTYELVKEAAYKYKTNRAAADALGCHPYSFYRACYLGGIVSPAERKRKEKTHLSKEKLLDWFGGSDQLFEQFEKFEADNLVERWFHYDRSSAYRGFISGYNVFRKFSGGVDLPPAKSQQADPE